MIDIMARIFFPGKTNFSTDPGPKNMCFFEKIFFSIIGLGPKSIWEHLAHFCPHTDPGRAHISGMWSHFFAQNLFCPGYTKKRSFETIFLRNFFQKKLVRDDFPTAAHWPASSFAKFPGRIENSGFFCGIGLEDGTFTVEIPIENGVL